MARITQRELDSMVTRVIIATGAPAVMVDEAGAYLVGHLYIDCAYGGYALYRTVNLSGGATDMLDTGHVSARELYGLLSAYLRGIYQGIAHATSGAPLTLSAA
jgi:hypothetical protein